MDIQFHASSLISEVKKERKKIFKVKPTTEIIHTSLPKYSSKYKRNISHSVILIEVLFYKI